jgi:uncharacterized cupin superfamily protein
MTPVSNRSSLHYSWGNNCDGWHLLDDDRLSVIEELVPAGESEVRHFHVRAQQFFYVLTGAVILEMDGAIHRLRTGDGLHVAAGVPHQLSNQGTEPARFLVISSPKSHGDRIDA